MQLSNKYPEVGPVSHKLIYMYVCVCVNSGNISGQEIKGKVHPCTSTEALYRPYGP